MRGGPIEAAYWSHNGRHLAAFAFPMRDARFDSPMARIGIGQRLEQQQEEEADEGIVLKLDPRMAKR